MELKAPKTEGGLGEGGLVWRKAQVWLGWGGVGLAFPGVGQAAVLTALPRPPRAGPSRCLSAGAVPGAAAQNIKIFLRFISSPPPTHLAYLKSLQFGGESYFNPLVPISLITVSIDKRSWL